MRNLPRAVTMSIASLLLASTAEAQVDKPLNKCAVDAVVSGTVCIDKYEASVSSTLRADLEARFRSRTASNRAGL
jgi:hypothetical protein